MFTRVRFMGLLYKYCLLVILLIINNYTVINDKFIKINLYKI